MAVASVARTTLACRRSLSREQCGDRGGSPSSIGRARQRQQQGADQKQGRQKPEGVVEVLAQAQPGEASVDGHLRPSGARTIAARPSPPRPASGSRSAVISCPFAADAPLPLARPLRAQKRRKAPNPCLTRRPYRTGAPLPTRLPGAPCNSRSLLYLRIAATAENQKQD